MYLSGNSLAGKTENINNFYKVQHITASDYCKALRFNTSSLCLVCGLAVLTVHFDACMQVIRRSFSGRPTLLRLFYVSETRGGDCSEPELSPPNRCKESNKDEEGVELLADVSLFQRPILRSYTLTNLRRSVGCCTDHICGSHVPAPAAPVSPERGH